MFTLEIKTENAAFKDPFTGEEDNIVEATEIRSILAKVSLALENGDMSGILMDHNGNRVGHWRR